MGGESPLQEVRCKVRNVWPIHILRFNAGEQHSFSASANADCVTHLLVGVPHFNDKGDELLYMVNGHWLTPQNIECGVLPILEILECRENESVMK